MKCKNCGNPIEKGQTACSFCDEPVTVKVKEPFKWTKKKIIALCVSAVSLLLVVAILAALFSILFYYVFTAVSGGFAIIISTIAASILGALLFPVKDEEEEAEA